jgi:hypothetical protein
MYWDIEKREEKTIIGDADGYQLTANKEKMLVSNKGSLAVIKVASDQKMDKKVPTGEMEISSSSGGIIYFMDILICPGCGSKELELKTEELTCKDCGRSYGHQKSIIDFRL